MALSNNINRYIEIDARLSDFNCLKNAVLSNKSLNQIISISKINWDDILYELYKNNYYEICDMWNRGISPKVIAKNLELSKNHIISVLKLSYKNGDTDYTTKKSAKNGAKKRNKRNVKPILCSSNNTAYSDINVLINNSINIFGLKLSNWKVNEILNGHRRYDNLDFVHISQKEFNEMKEKLPEQCLFW